MSEPQCDDGDVRARFQQSHRRRMPQGVHADSFRPQRKAGLPGGRDVVGEAVFDRVPAEPGAGNGRESGSSGAPPRSVSQTRSTRTVNFVSGVGIPGTGDPPQLQDDHDDENPQADQQRARYGNSPQVLHRHHVLERERDGPSGRRANQHPPEQPAPLGAAQRLPRIQSRSVLTATAGFEVLPGPHVPQNG